MGQSKFPQKDFLSLTAVDNSPCGILIVDGDRKIVLINKELERIFGYSRNELLGQPYEILVPMRFRNTYDAFDQGFKPDPQPLAMGSGLELHGRRKDGSEVPIEIGLNPFRSDDGLFLFCSIIDVSGRKRVEQQLLLAIESAPSGITMIDASGLIRLVNKETERLFGYPRDELLGQSIEMLVPGHSREKHSNYRQQYWANPSARLMGGGRDLYGMRKDGTEIPLEIGLNPVETDQGRFVLCAIVDISARKKAEQALQDAAEELKRSNRQLEQFAYIASHDLQEPLRVIAGFLDLLSERYKPQLDEKARTYIGFAADAAKRMSQLITDLLKYSRVERGVKEPKRVDLNKCFQVAIANLQASIQEAGSTITCEELPTVRGNETELTQLFQNLVGNAIKFRRNDVSSQIHVGHQAGVDHWVISIRDNGIGIAPEHHRKIFLIFQRLHGKKEYPGTGIGLALCEKIADQHGGRIWVDSDPGKGSTFYFTLPFHNPLN